MWKDYINAYPSKSYYLTVIIDHENTRPTRKPSYLNTNNIEEHDKIILEPNR